MKISIAGIAFSIMFLVTVPLGALAENAAVDCDTAQADIAHLQHEKKSTDERIAKGVFSIMPIGLVLNTANSAAESGSKKERVALFSQDSGRRMW